MLRFGKVFLPKIMLTPIFLQSQNNQNLLAKRKIVNKLTAKGFCLIQNISICILFSKNYNKTMIKSTEIRLYIPCP